MLIRILEGLGMNIRGHLGSDFIGKRDIPFRKDGMHPADANPMSAFKVTHGGILARAYHADHGLIVVVVRRRRRSWGLCHQAAAKG